VIRKVAASPGESPRPRLGLQRPWWNEQRMPYNAQGLVDLLEIYHARRVRNQLIAQLRRLQVVDPANPYQDAARREEAHDHYEAMLLILAELLVNLGDEAPLD
jgi:hypothetical protein